LPRRAVLQSPLLGALATGALALACAVEPTSEPQPTPPADPPAAEAPAEPRPPRCCLRERGRLAATLPTGAPTTLAADLQAGDLVEIVAPQDDTDFALRLVDPAGTRRLRIDSPRGISEPEHLVFVADTAGRHLLEVEPPSSGPDGTFRLEVLALHPATPRDRLRARACAALAEGHELRRARQCSQAIPAYQLAAETHAALGDPESEARAHVWVAHCLVRSGRPQEAEETLQSAVATFRRLDEAEEEARALGDLGNLLHDLGRIDPALDAYRRGLDLWRDLDDLAGEAATLIRLANVHKTTDQLGAAEIRYKEALTVWEELDIPEEQALTLANLAGVYSLTGDYDLALDLLERGAKLLPDTAPAGDRAFFAEERALVYRRQGDLPRALRAYEEALRLRRNDRPEARIPALHGLGLVHDQAGHPAAAAERYRQALALAGDGDHRLWEGLLLQSLGWTHLRRGQLDPALDHFTRALPILQEVGYTAAEVSSLTGIARVERARGHLEAASAWAQRALDAVEEVRAGTDRSELQASLLDIQRGAFDFAVDTLVELDRRNPGQGYDRRAFETSERGRARWLLDTLPGATDRESTNADRAVSEAESQRLDSLRQRVNRAEAERLRHLANGPTPTDPAVLARTEQALRAALEDLRAAQRRSRPTAESPDTSTYPLHLPEIQKTILPPDTLLLAYHLGETRSHLWAISHDAIESFVLPDRETIESQARDLHHLLAQSDRRATGRQAELHAADLADLLLAPAAEIIGRHSRLIATLDGDLHTVPLGALPHPTEEGILLQHHQVTYAPSASAAAWLDGRPHPIHPVHPTGAPDDRLLALLADPVFGPDDDRLTDSAETTSRQELARSGPLALDLPRLRYAEEEADRILTRVDPDRSLARRGHAATKDLVTSGALTGYPIVHFATHGWLNADHPELSALVLSRIDDHGRPRDGTLWAHEIAALDLPSDLVVLSACDTGLGTRIGGEGLVGLSHAFFRAGASRLLVSLWRVDDRAAPELMDRFYQGFLNEGLEPAEALRRAQLALRQDPRWQRPYFWAGWVLQGEPTHPAANRVSHRGDAGRSIPDPGYQQATHDPRRSEP
jgi:CHAT domain-containing protein/Tfp pilus assembly protein PilF